jgi:molecular chaperone HscB
MEWREAIEDARSAKDIATLEDLFHEMQAESKSLQTHLTQLLDEKKDYATATETTRKLIFIDKVCADIQKAIEQLE